jgi:hypothetical protein
MGLTGSGISIPPSLLSSKHIVHHLAFHTRAGSHLDTAIKGLYLVMGKIRDTHLLRDRKLVCASIARPFIVACFRGYYKQISACRTEQHEI